MMDPWITFGSALWLGILTSISPCPLATNIAAVSFLSKRISHPLAVCISGFSYTAGRMAAYSVLSWIIVNSLLSVSQTAQFLQKYMGKALGPLLMITGLFLLGALKIKLPGISLSQEHQNKLAKSGAPGALLLGFIFALAFCPFSAALFFGSLIPMVLNGKTGILLPLVYGFGTGIPVVIIAAAIAFGAVSMNHCFNITSKIEFYFRKITGAIFILAGLYYSGIYLLRLF